MIVIKQKKKRKIYFLILIGILFLIIFMVCFSKEQKKEYNIIPAGKMIFVNQNGKEEKMDVEEFLPCAVAGLFSPKENEEVLKMQMVIARTYILNKMGDKVSMDAKELGIDFKSYEDMETMYGNEYMNNYRLWKKFVEETNLQVIKYQDKLIKPYFHGASMGLTRNGNEVLGKGYEYLQSVESKWDMECPQYLYTSKYTIEDFIKKLKEYDSAIELTVENFFDKFTIDQKCSVGYVMSVHADKKEIGSEEFCKIFQIPSQYFSVEKFQTAKDQTIRIIAKGKGNGLGVSLFGAKKMAEEGKNYKEILEYYYKNVVIG